MTTDRKQAVPSTFTGTITPPIHDQLLRAQARIAELEGELEMTQSALAHTWGQGGEWDTNSVWVCEEHPWLLWPDNDPDCAVPGMPPINLRAQLAAKNACIAELEAEKAERNRPCVWGKTKDLLPAYTQGCRTDYISRYKFKFCPDCGHPVEVKEEK